MKSAAINYIGTNEMKSTAINSISVNEAQMKRNVQLLKGQCHEIFELYFFSLIEPIWALDKQAKMVFS